YSSNHFDSVALGSAASVALQPRVGILSKWRVGPCGAHSYHLVADGTNLARANKPHCVCQGLNATSAFARSRSFFCLSGCRSIGKLRTFCKRWETSAGLI